MAIVLIAALLMPALTFAQDAAAEGAETPAAKETTFMDFIAAGGWAMWPLGALSLMWVALVVYLALQLNKKKFSPPELRAAVLENMGECRVRSSIELAASSPTFLGRMLASALPHVDATDPETLGRDDVEDAVAEFTVKENRPYMATITYFSIIAQAAPMLGLLGTVSGMIKAFQTLGISGGSDPGALAANISEALITTAAGLIIAIPAIFGFYYFKNQLNSLVADCHASVQEAMDASLAAVHADQQLAKVPEGLQAAG